MLTLVNINLHTKFEMPSLLFEKHDRGPKIQTSSQRVLTKGCIAAADFVMEKNLM